MKFGDQETRCRLRGKPLHQKNCNKIMLGVARQTYANMKTILGTKCFVFLAWS